MSGTSKSGTTTNTKRNRDSPPSPNRATENTKKFVMAPPTPTEQESLASVILKINGTLSAIQCDMQEMRLEFNGKLDQLGIQMSNRFEQWEKEKLEIVNCQAALETRMDQLERKQKRANIVITGLPANSNNDLSTKNYIEQLFTDNLGLNLKVTDAFQIKTKDSKGKVIATMGSVEDKTAVLKNKKLLSQSKGMSSQKIFVQDDLIKKDEMIQFRAREFARKMKGENKDVRIGFKKVYVDKVLHIWDEKEETFVNRKN